MVFPRAKYPLIHVNNFCRAFMMEDTTPPRHRPKQLERGGHCARRAAIRAMPGQWQQAKQAVKVDISQPARRMFERALNCCLKFRVCSVPRCRLTVHEV